MIWKRGGRLDGLVLGDDRHDGLMVSESSSSVSRLGLGFLSRYVVTLDLRNRKMYLKKERGFRHVDEDPGLGLGLIRTDGRVLVEVVDDDTPAARAGVRPFDLVLKVRDLDVAMARKAEVYRKLDAPCKIVRLTIRRGDKEMGVTR
jgi:S1-C subfamily serine protease